MRLEVLNRMAHEPAEQALLRCCGSTEWARAMAASRPFASAEAMIESADAIWRGLGPSDWHEAFAAHPRIGETSPGWSAQEQSRVSRADASVHSRLAAANREYEARFGRTFIVCATGRSAENVLAILEQRLGNGPAEELRIAADEQRKITRLRIERLLTEPAS
jgi:OHCU decarboxylase